MSPIKTLSLSPVGGEDCTIFNDWSMTVGHISIFTYRLSFVSSINGQFWAAS
jgi:hypothetical protein